MSGLADMLALRELISKVGNTTKMIVIATNTEKATIVILGIFKVISSKHYPLIIAELV